MTYTVRYKTPVGISQEHPDEVHTDADPLLTLLWMDDEEITRFVQIPLANVIDIEKVQP